MKKFYSLSCLIFSLFYNVDLRGQIKMNYVVENPPVNIHNNDIPYGINKPVTPHVTGTQSTFSDYYDRSTSFMVPTYSLNPTTEFYFLSSVGSGALVGVDYDNSANVMIDELLVLFAAKIAITGNKVYDAHIYNAATSGLPTGSPVGSTTYSFANINAPVNANAPKLTTYNSTFNFTSITFSSPVSVSGDFVAVVEIDDSNHVGGYQPDVVYLYTNNCLSDGNAEDRICIYPVPNAQKLFGGTVPMQWYTANSFWATVGFSYVFDCDAMIIPIVQGETHTLSTNNIKGKTNGLTFLGHYPSPAKEFIKINYELESKNKVVNLRIFDITGRTVLETNEIDVEAGKHSFDINVETFAAGNLYYTIKTDDGKISSKFTVIK